MDYWGKLECPRLTQEEEIAAFDRGDRDLLVRSVIPWVVKIAGEVCERYGYRDRHGAVSAGMFALARTLETSFDPRKSKLITFCTRVVYWAVTHEIEIETRESRRFVPISNVSKQGQEIMRQPPDKPQGSIDDKDACEFLLRYACWLTDAQREVLQMRADGMEVKDIAAVRECTEVAVRMLLKKAIGNIRKSLEIDGIREIMEEAVK